MIKWISVFLCLVLFLFPQPVSAQKELQVIREGDRNSMKIALTFDDGPHPYRTDDVLDLLEKYKIKATFFVVGENVSYYPEPFKRTVAMGHEIGNHTYHHTPLSDTCEKTVMEEISQTDEIIFKTVGFHHRTRRSYSLFIAVQFFQKYLPAQIRLTQPRLPSYNVYASEIPLYCLAHVHQYDLQSTPEEVLLYLPLYR